uniref:hypothetical protein n=1 Tax=Alistipes putredinis TaxID=28117 RepID=UPI003FD89421
SIFVMKSLTLITFSNLKMLSMKFNFTYLWSLSALQMCCTSCSDSDPAPTPEEDETVSLIATLENERLWESGDEVLINGMKYTVEEGVGSAAATIKVPRAEHYYAAYDTGTGTVRKTYSRRNLPRHRMFRRIWPAPWLHQASPPPFHSKICWDLSA